ncbi:MAG: response regulator [Bdellovibrionales bacterium]
MSKLKGMIVDDSLMMRKILAKMVGEAQDMEISGQASDPFEARDLILAQMPDVMILDIEMPKMDGLTFLEKVMNHKPIPVLIFSGHAKSGSQIALKALELGAVDILEKPQDLTKAFEQIKDTILTKFVGPRALGFGLSKTPPRRRRAKPPCSARTSMRPLCWRLPLQRAAPKP